ncbi:MAG: tRNA dihydrouridine(20/20a) synthase DusA [Burkholderiales bacterium]|jgi:tRNA-dihydrouridine synthase A|nr:tRNA dihydrouridine(20/20a) synthase DusA [Burkholderiales bacterium]
MPDVSLFRYAVAPMLDWTDRHCRYFHRLLSRRAWLYTEMIPTPAILHGEVSRLLAFNEVEHPVALQIGGSHPRECAVAAKAAARFGYDEININCGCPSDRVQVGRFGACLMATPEGVADCVKAMRDAATLPVSVKHRIGIDDRTEYGFVRDFVGTVAAAGCRLFIVHARPAILKGLSPKENRDIPPLDYEKVYRLQRDFPSLFFMLNGGIDRWETLEDVAATLTKINPASGVMVGRWAYHDPYHLAQIDSRLFHDTTPPPSRRDILEALKHYAEKEKARGAVPRHIARHVLGLYLGEKNARLFRQCLSSHELLAADDPAIFDQAAARVLS